jgi:hypothetical protein
MNRKGIWVASLATSTVGLTANCTEYNRFDSIKKKKREQFIEAGAEDIIL